jgi:DNA (cytosine-5)-methyltransferase 1
MVRQAKVGTRVWVERKNDYPTGMHGLRRFEGFSHRFFDYTDRPFPAVMTEPVKVIIEYAGGVTPASEQPGKPPYQVPSMAEITAVPWNGFTAASTFSGCGGSSLGYRMAGFRLAWASEFIPAAADTYRVNMSPGTILDTRDIREVTAADVLKALGMLPGELDLLDGSPPCASFSTAGKREKHWGEAKAYSDTTQRVDDLFFEFARLVDGIRPRVFVAENVSGLVKGVAKGYFKLVHKALRDCGYQVEARLLNAAWLGVPQARQRLIFIGVRDDLPAVPVFPKPLPYQYTVRDALPWILLQGDNGDNGGYGVGGTMRAADRPSPTILTGPTNGNQHAPPGVILTVGDIVSQRGPKAQMRVSPADTPADTVAAKGMGNVREHQAAIVVGVGDIITQRGPGAPVRVADPADPADPADTIAANGFSNVGRHQAAIVTRVVHDTSGERGLGDVTDAPSPTITVGINGINSHHFQVEEIGGPATTHDPETGEGISISTVRIHGLDDSTQCRKLTLRELRRLSGFPDDFELTGTYVQRWERIGRAVPPVMMSHIATTVRDGILQPLRVQGVI